MTNTSLYPAKEGAAYFRFATNEYNTIPKELKKKAIIPTLCMHTDLHSGTEPKCTKL